MAPFDIPIVINDQVEYFIDYFQTKLRNRFTLWMGRSTRYMSMMKKILREHQLPEDLIYLAMIESGFSTKAYSRAHAVGPWQFIRETGERYGLRVNSWWMNEKIRLNRPGRLPNICPISITGLAPGIWLPRI